MIKVRVLKTDTIDQVMAGYPEHEIAEEHYHGDGHFIILREPVEIAAAAQAEKTKHLQTIDLASIRAIREWIAKRSDAPELIKNFEAQAKEIRNNLNKK